MCHFMLLTALSSGAKEEEKAHFCIKIAIYEANHLFYSHRLGFYGSIDENKFMIVQPSVYSCK